MLTSGPTTPEGGAEGAIAPPPTPNEWRRQAINTKKNRGKGLQNVKTLIEMSIPKYHIMYH